MGLRAYALAAVAGAIALALAAAAVVWYGHGRYAAGQADERARAERVRAAIQAAMQQEKDYADARYRGAVLARQRTEARAAEQDRRRAAHVAQLRGLLDQYRNRTHAADARGGSDATGPDWIGVFGECVARAESLGRRLGEVGKDAAGWADQVNGLQGYVHGLHTGVERAGQ